MDLVTSKMDFITSKISEWLTIGRKEVTVGTKISEGGYAVVYKAFDTTTNELYALKKIFLKDKETEEVMRNEVKIWKELQEHPNIVKFIDASIQKTSKGKYLNILSEYWGDGHLLDLLEKYNGKLQESQILLIMKHIVRGIKYMHQQDPPVAHRDIKVENILLQGKNFKLWDFGSSSKETLDPNKATDDEVEDQIEKFEKYTTFMYRPPEMIDKYKKWKVDLKVDVWMIGWVLFALCFFKHPFQDAQKLAILNAHYFFPNDNESKRRIGEKLRDLIRHCLTPDPSQRPDIFELQDLLETWEDFDKIEINPLAQKLKDEDLKKNNKKMVTQKKNEINFEGRKNDDLTPNELKELQVKLRKQKMEDEKKLHVPVYTDYHAKMQDELYSKPIKAADSNKKKDNDLDWANFDNKTAKKQKKEVPSDNFWDQSIQPSVGKGGKESQAKTNDKDFDFDFNKNQNKQTERIESSDKTDFFGFTENKYWDEPSQDAWFDNLDKKKGKSQKKDDDFDFGFGNSSKAKVQSKPKDNAKEFFDFDKKEQVQEVNDLIDVKSKRSKPVFEEYFFSNNEDEDDDTSADQGLISNLKKLYEKDGLVQDKPKVDILQPEIPGVLKKQNEFLPEVKVKGEGFWEEQKNQARGFGYQQQSNYFGLSAAGPASSAQYDPFTGQTLVPPSHPHGHRSSSTQNVNSKPR